MDNIISATENDVKAIEDAKRIEELAKIACNMLLDAARKADSRKNLVICAVFGPITSGNPHRTPEANADDIRTAMELVAETAPRQDLRKTFLVFDQLVFEKKLESLMRINDIGKERALAIFLRPVLELRLINRAYFLSLSVLSSGSNWIYQHIRRHHHGIEVVHVAVVKRPVLMS